MEISFPLSPNGRFTMIYGIVMTMQSYQHTRKYYLLNEQSSHLYYPTMSIVYIKCIIQCPSDNCIFHYIVISVSISFWLLWVSYISRRWIHTLLVHLYHAPNFSEAWTVKTFMHMSTFSMLSVFFLSNLFFVRK